MNTENTRKNLRGEEPSSPVDNWVIRIGKISLLVWLIIVALVCCSYLLYVAFVQQRIQPRISATLSAVPTQAAIPSATDISTFLPSPTP